MAAVAVSSAAMAQATISGVFNVDVQNRMANAAVTSGTVYTDNAARTVGMGDAQLRFSTTEDLGGGMKMSATAVMDADAGRAGTVLGMGYSASLSGGFGNVTLRNYLAGKAELGAPVSTDTDMNNVAGGYNTRTRLQYSIPEIIKGVTLDLYTSLSGTGGPSVATGRAFTELDETMGFDIGYSFGQAYVSASGTLDDAENASIYAGYNFGVAKIDLGYGQYDGGHTELAIVVPMGAVTATLHTMNSDLNDAYGVRVAYALSKRTSVSLNYTDATKSEVAAAVGNNYRVRVSHSF